MKRVSCTAATALLFFGSTLALAKPIAFSHGTTVMAEYGAGTMKEAQVFYAPKYFLSLGPGYLELESDIDHRRREITYARVNYLVKRWNMDGAQANVFVWGGAGQAYVSEINDHEFTGNAGAQFDYETRRVYASIKTDWYEASAFSHRIDTLQLGLAPYKHDYDKLATWAVVQARRYTRRDPRGHRVGAVAASVQGWWMDRGRGHRRWQAASHGHGQFLNLE